MSLSTTYRDRATHRWADTTTLVLIVWAVTVFSYLIASLRGNGDMMSTDDAMRLVEVRDFLAGQNWFDLTQYRLNPPEGVPTHWSRLIDLPLAVLIRGAEFLVSAALAERIAAVVWPVALLLIFLAGVARLARALAGDAAAQLALIFAAVMAPVLQHFRPGAIDHHNAQLVLLVWSLALVACAQPRHVAANAQEMAPARRARSMALAGGLCAFSLAIGLEMAPAIVALAGAVVLQWIVRGDDAKSATAAFALALAEATLVLFIVTVPPAHYGLVACDAFSIVHVVAAGFGGVGLAILVASSRLSTGWRRLAGAAGLAALLMATLTFGFRSCLGDPYGELEPRMVALWLSNVSEARSIVSLMRDLPQEVLPYYGLPVIGLLLGLRCCRQRPEQCWNWIGGIAVLAALTLVALWQVRAAAAANAVAVVLTTAALVRTFPAPEGAAVAFGLSGAALVAAALVNPLTLIGLGNGSAHALERATGTAAPQVIADGPGTCRRAADYAGLANLPRGLVLAFIDAGPFVLMTTPHAVLAAPYHRNGPGNAAMLDVFLGDPDEAAARMRALGVRYLAFCPGAPERYNYTRAAPNGLAALLGRGQVPDFLERINLDGSDLAVYRPRQ